MPELLENADEKLSTGMRRLLDFLWQEWKGLQVQIESLNTDLEQIVGSDAACVRLQQIPGVGPMVLTAVVSAIGNGAAFKKGREFAAWLGLVPRQGSTGGKAKLLGISKRGNPYLRKMFIHGARAAVLRVKREGSSLGQWMSGLETRGRRQRRDRRDRQQAGQDHLGSFGQRERLSSKAQSTCLFQLDEVGFEVRFAEVCSGRGDGNTVKRRA